MENEFILLKKPDWEDLRKIIASSIQENLKTGQKQFLKSAEVRKMLGGISAAKLQTLRVGGHLPAINAEGIWLYDVEDIIKFTNKNKINAEEGIKHE
jgi:hypothetical protein